jgi:hypothetical protein
MSSPRLPEEILDHVIDHLHKTQDALRNCCLVSKSWIPRSRKHLFADITFPTEESLRSWKQTFPDASISPARYAKILSVRYPQVVAAAEAEAEAEAEACGWIGGFSRVVRFRVYSHTDSGERMNSLVLFHGFSPVIKSLHIIIPALPSSRIFNLILSFPLLEDLVVIIREAWPDDDGSEGDETSTATHPLSLPTFVGSLELYLEGGMSPLARRLLSLPGGIHFQKLDLTWVRDGDLLTTTALVEGCSHTLEFLDITCNFLGKWDWHLRPHRYSFLYLGVAGPTSIDLSKATQLKDVAFQPATWNVQWVIAALQTITLRHRNLRHITIKVSYYLTLVRYFKNIRQGIGEANCGQWLDLDRLLVQLWESHSVRPNVVCDTANRAMNNCVKSLLPEGTKRGILDFGKH